MTRNIKKFRISALCLTLLFVLTTAIGLLALPLKDTYAQLGSVNPGTLKFKQVSAGEDFAIALTYDNDLYAWSLLEKSGDDVYKINESGNTLGEYYPSVPTRLDIELSGVTYSESDKSIQKVGVNYEDRGSFKFIGHGTAESDSVTNNTSAPDSIKQIAATRTTAAFITNKGLIYTWGDEKSEPTSSGLIPTGLLLRPIVNSDKYYGTDTSARGKYIPSLVDYGEANNLLPIGTSGESYCNTVSSISGSEYNYLANLSRESNVNEYFIWGQSVYGQQSTKQSGYDFNKSSIENNRRFVADRNPDNTGDININCPVYLGDGTVYYYNNSTSTAVDDRNKLFVRGKNFAVTTDNPDNIKGNVFGLTSGESEKSLGGGTYKKDDMKIEITSAVTYGFQSLGTVELTASARASFNKAKDITADDAKIETSLPTLSAGSGYGFLLSNSKIWFWGDNRLYGKIANSTSLSQVSSLTDDYVQVVAGKVVTGDPILEQIGDNANNKATKNDSKWSTQEGEEGKFATDYVDGNTVISAALSSTGSVKVFGSIDGVSFSDNLDKLFKIHYGVLTGSNVANKIVALFPGYGNSLFALSNLGKIYMISGAVKDADSETPSVEFKCKLYDEFTNKGATDKDSVISNWTLGAANEIEFTGGYYDTETKTYDSSAVTVSMKADNTNAVADTHAQVNAKYDVIAADYSGDAYRMILPIAQKKKTTGNKTTGYINIVGTNNEIDGKLKARVADTPGGSASPDFSMEFYWIWQEGTGANAVQKQSAEPIPDDVAFRYFDITYSYTAPTTGENPTPADITFTVKPLRSTAGKSILIKYWVGRYDAEVAFTKVATESDADNMAFYDFKQAEVKVAIGDTHWTAEYNTQRKAYTDSKPDNAKILEAMNANSTVPLLDPNNPYNNQYSLAVMNVSAGFDAVFDKIKTVIENFDADNAKSAMPGFIYNSTTGDKGFPASSRIAAGSLKYYNRYAEQDYNNIYRYLADDFDGDILDIVSDIGYISNDYFTAELNTPEIIVNFADFLPKDTELTSEQLTELLNLFTRTDANGNMLRFDNKYGLTMEIVTEKKTVANSGGEGTVEIDVPVGIKFSYKVITITATASMGKDSVTYYNGNSAQKYDVSSPLLVKTAKSTSAENYMLRPLISDGINYDVRLSNSMDGVNQGKFRAIEVFTQGSLVFEDKKGSGQLATVAPHSIYGAPLAFIDAENLANAGNSGLPQKSNTYIYGDITLNMDEIGEGNEKNCYTVDLADLFPHPANSDLQNIRISYNGDTSGNALIALANTFLSGKNGNALELINVSSTKFTLRARRALEKDDIYEFKLEVRRVLPGTTESTFGYDSSDGTYPEAETVYIKFKVKILFDKEKALDNDKAVTGLPFKDSTINKNESLTLDYRLNINTDILELDDDCVSVSAYSTDPNVVSVEYNKDGKKLDFTVHSSGTVLIKYTVRYFEYEVTDSFELKVAMLSSMQETVKVMDEKKVYFNSLKSYLNRVNDLGNIALDLKEDANTKLPYRFEITETENALDKPDAECEWMPLESIPFLNNVYLDPSEDKAFIGLIMGKFEPTEENPDPPVVRVVVNFTSGDNDYGVAFRVAPAAQTLRDKESIGKTKLELIINKGAGTIIIANHDTNNNAIEERREFEKVGDNSYSVSVNYFISMMSGAYSGNNVYEIVAVNATDGINSYSKYVDVTTNRSENANAIIITPLYPTEEGKPCNIQVSVRYTGNSKDVTLLNFSLTVTGIKTVLESEEYIKIILIAFFSVLLVLVIIFFIRMGVYWKKKADQRRIIKKNQTLIKMRDKMHNKTEAVSKEQLVRTKLKMEDPKYAKVFNEMRQNKEAQTGITLDNSLVAQKADKKEKAAKESKKKKKGGKKSLEELQAELAAKREAVARMQAGDFSDMPEGMAPVDGMPPIENAEAEQPVINDVPAFDSEVQFDGMSAEQLDEQLSETFGADSIVFEPLDDNDNGNQG